MWAQCCDKKTDIGSGRHLDPVAHRQHSQPWVYISVSGTVDLISLEGSRMRDKNMAKASAVCRYLRSVEAYTLRRTAQCPPCVKQHARALMLRSATSG